MAAYSTLQDIIVSLGKHVASMVSILQEIARLHEIVVQELGSSLPAKNYLNSGARPKQLSSLHGECWKHGLQYDSDPPYSTWTFCAGAKVQIPKDCKDINTDPIFNVWTWESFNFNCFLDFAAELSVHDFSDPKKPGPVQRSSPHRWHPWRAPHRSSPCQGSPLEPTLMFCKRAPLEQENMGIFRILQNAQCTGL